MQSSAQKAGDFLLSGTHRIADARRPPRRAIAAFDAELDEKGIIAIERRSSRVNQGSAFYAKAAPLRRANDLDGIDRDPWPARIDRDGAWRSHFGPGNDSI